MAELRRVESTIDCSVIRGEFGTSRMVLARFRQSILKEP